MGRVAMLIGLLLSSASLLTGSVWPADQVQTFRKEVKQIVGSAQSQDDARAAAIAKARRDAVEEAGVWLESQSVVQDFKLEKDQVTTLAIGITQTKVVEEGPFLENGAVGYRVVAEVRVDNSALAEHVKEFLANRAQMEQAKASNEREQFLLARLADLERQMAVLKSASPEQRQAVRDSVQENARQLSASEWFYKGVALVTPRGNQHTDPARAIAYYSEALELAPDFVSAYINRGSAFHQTGQLQRAIQDFDQALKLDPDNARAYYNRGVVYGASGQLQRAIKDYDQALKLDPNFVFAYVERGIAFDETGQLRRAIQDYDQALQLDPNNVFAYSNRGIAYAHLSQFPRAIQEFDQAPKLDPNDANSYYNRGSAYADLGQLQRAIQDYDQTLKLDPNDVLAYNHRGNAYFKLRQRGPAYQDFRKACHLGNEAACNWLNSNPE